MKKLLCLLLVLSLLCSMPVFAAEEAEKELDLTVDTNVQGSLSMDRIKARLNPPKRGEVEDNFIFPGPYVQNAAFPAKGTIGLTFGGICSGKSNQYFCMMIYKGSEAVGEPVASDYNSFPEVGYALFDLRLMWEKDYAAPGQYTVVSFTADLQGNTLVPVEDTASMAHIYLYDEVPIPERAFLINWETGESYEDKVFLAYGETNVLAAARYPAISLGGGGGDANFSADYVQVQKVGGLFFVTPNYCRDTTGGFSYSGYRKTDLPIEICLTNQGHVSSTSFDAGAPTLYMNGYRLHICGLCGEMTQEELDCFVRVFNHFKDIPAGSWYIPEVREAVHLGLFNGVSKTEFGPEASMTRAMLVTVLWRYEGKPEAAPSDYVDVPDDAWYHAALDWATEQGIVNGVGDGKFEPEETLTREQIATILCRYAQKKNALTEISGDPAGFPDVSELSDWAEEGMSWALGHGIINGTSEVDGTYLQPLAPATRAQVSAIMVRLIGKLSTAQRALPDLTDAIAGGKEALSQDSNVYVHWALYEDGLLQIGVEGNDGSTEAYTTGLYPWAEYKDQIRTVEVLYGAKMIGGDMFIRYPNLETVILADSVVHIDHSAFQECTNLKEIRLSNKLERIEVDAFAGCTSLQEIAFPDTLLALGIRSFEGCTALQTVSFGNNLRLISDSSFRNCAALKEIVLPDSVSAIGPNVFQGCVSLERAVMPLYLDSLNNRLFEGCVSLKDIDLPYKTLWPRSEVFMNCTSLEKVFLPVVMNRMYSSFFKGCTSLKEVYSLSTQLEVQYAIPTDYPFGDPAQVTIYGIPDSDVAAIAAKHGYTFCNILEE